MPEHTGVLVVARSAIVTHGAVCRSALDSIKFATLSGAFYT